MKERCLGYNRDGGAYDCITQSVSSGRTRIIERVPTWLLSGSALNSKSKENSKANVVVMGRHHCY